MVGRYRYRSYLPTHEFTGENWRCKSEQFDEERKTAVKNLMTMSLYERINKISMAQKPTFVYVQ